MMNIAKAATEDQKIITLEFWPTPNAEVFGPDEYRIVVWPRFLQEKIIYRSSDVVEAVHLFGSLYDSYVPVEAVEPDWASQEEYGNAFAEWCEQNYCDPVESHMWGEYNSLTD